MSVSLLTHSSLFEKQDKIQADFEEFHQNNPHVYEMFCVCALRAIYKRKRIGAKMIIEHMRWELTFKTEDESDFKINNNYTRCYARKFMQDYPQYEGYFEIRKLHPVNKKILITRGISCLKER